MCDKIGCAIGTPFLITNTMWIYFINNIGIQAVEYKTTEHVGHILPFWDPDPQFSKPDNQRQPININNKRRFHNLNQETQHNITKKSSLKRDRYRYEINRPSLESEKYTFRAKLRTTTTKKPYSIRTVKRASDPESRSTRFTPMYLKEKDDKTTTNAHKEANKEKKIKMDEDDNFVLSVYTIKDQFNSLLSEYPTVQTEWETLGRTASYINIELLKMSLRSDKNFRAHDDRFVENEPKEKKIIFIAHALTSMGLKNLFSLTTKKYLKELISYYIAHLDNFDIFLIPMANPDGYISQNLPYWSKSYAPMSACPGVHVDRNFDVAWNSTVEMSSCNQRYPGPVPFSEPESRAVRDVFHRMSHKIAAYFHVHAGTYDWDTFKGDAVLYPRGFTEAQSDDDKYIDLKGEIDEAIKNANFKVISVTVDTLYNWYGRVTGTSVDYAATIYGIPYAMEMVMQVYQDPATLVFKELIFDNKEELEYYALTEIWRRVFNVTFSNIFKKMDATEAT